MLENKGDFKDWLKHLQDMQQDGWTHINPDFNHGLPHPHISWKYLEEISLSENPKHKNSSKAKTQLTISTDVKKNGGGLDTRMNKYGLIYSQIH